MKAASAQLDSIVENVNEAMNALLSQDKAAEDENRWRNRGWAAILFLLALHCYPPGGRFAFEFRDSVPFFGLVLAAIYFLCREIRKTPQVLKAQYLVIDGGGILIRGTESDDSNSYATAWIGRGTDGVELAFYSKQLFEDEDSVGPKGAARLSISPQGPSFSLYDETSVERIAIEMKDGEPIIRLLDSHGNTRTEVGLIGEEPGISILDADETPRATLRIDENGPSLSLQDILGNPVAVLDVSSNNAKFSLDGYEAQIAIRSAKGEKPEVLLGLTEDGPKLSLSQTFCDSAAELGFIGSEPLLTFKGMEGNQLFRLGVLGGEPEVILFANEASESKASCSLRMLEGEPRLEMCDLNGELRAQPWPKGIALLNNDNQVFWQAP